VSALTRSLIAASTSAPCRPATAPPRVEHFGNQAPDLLEFGDTEAARWSPRGCPDEAPKVTNGVSGSNGMPFLLQVIAARTNAFSETLPLRPLGLRSTSIRWLVGAARDDVEALGRAAIPPAPWHSRPRFWHRLEVGRSASAKATALAAITSSGAALQAREDRRVQLLGQRLVVAQISPPRGPRSDLCVVVVVTCACGTGEACTPPATRPAKCAMSTNR